MGANPSRSLLLVPWAMGTLSRTKALGTLVGSTARPQRVQIGLHERASPHCIEGPVHRPIFTDFYRFFPTFLGDLVGY